MATASLEEQDQQEALAAVRGQRERAAAIANIQQAIEDLERIKLPSRLKKVFIYWIAGGADIIDIIAFILEVVGLLSAGTLSFVVWLFSTIIDVAADIIIYLIARKASKKIKKFREMQEELPEMVRLLSRQYLRGLKGARNIKALRPIVNKIGLAVATARKSPMAKQVIAMGLDLIPIVEVFPWRTMGVYLMIKDEKATYKDAQLLIEQYREAASKLAA